MSSIEHSDQVRIYTGRATETLSREIAKSYGIELGASVIFQYADGEFQPSFEHNLRGCDVFIVQSTDRKSVV